MCVPIYPNDGSPDMYRNPVRPTRTGSHQNWFPFWNCFHWLGPDMKLCVRVNPLEGGCDAMREWDGDGLTPWHHTSTNDLRRSQTE